MKGIQEFSGLVLELFGKSKGISKTSKIIKGIQIHMNKNNKNNRSGKYRSGSILEISVACLTICVQNQTEREELPLGA